MNVVTGGTGFVGQALVTRLLARGDHVRVISRVAHAQGAPRSTHTAAEGRLEWFQGDIRDRATIAAAFRGARHVFHAAALVNSTAPYDEFERANVVATRNVVELALEARADRFVHVGTINVYGIPEAAGTMTERSPYREWGEPYADTKIRASRLLHEYTGRGMSCATIHPGFVYGPGDRAFVPTLIRQMRIGLMPLWGPQPATVNLVYVDDLVDALLLAAAVEAARDEEFLILNEERVALATICDAIARQLGIGYRTIRLPYAAMTALARLSVWLAHRGVLSRPMLSTTDVKSFGHQFRFSTAKARTVLGWMHTTPFEIGIERAIAAAAPRLPAPSSILP